MKTRIVSSLGVLIVASGALPAMAQTATFRPPTAPKATTAQSSSAPAQSKRSDTRPDKGPSLEETLHWIKNALGSGGGAEWITKFEGGNTGIGDNRSEIDRESGCNVEFVDRRTSTFILGHEPFTKKIDTTTETITANLGDLDPTSLKVKKFEIGSGGGWTSQASGFRIYADTTNLAKAISFTTGTDGINKTNQVSALQLYISSEEVGQRLANALSHAITLCGGKSSAF